MHYSEWTVSKDDARAMNWRDLYSVHRHVYMVFGSGPCCPDEMKTRILWRLERAGSGFMVLAVSERKPEFAPAGKILARPYPNEVFKLKSGLFSCTVNPCRVSGGRRVPVRGRDAVAGWFMEKAEARGFRASGLYVGPVSVARFRKGTGEVLFEKAEISGRFEVIDRELFKQALLGGIGREKAFGCGLVLPEAVSAAEKRAGRPVFFTAEGLTHELPPGCRKTEI